MNFVKKAALFVFLAVTVTLSAAPWANLGPKRVPKTLVVVSNYKSPRLMAELIQYESRTPYLLLPTPGSSDNRIFFCPAKKQALQIRAERLNSFVRFLNPKRIVVIGNEKVANQDYINLLDRSIPIVRIDGADWQRMAEELNFLLNLSHLDTNFKRLRETLLNDSRFYRPVSLPAYRQKEVLPAAENTAPEKKADDKAVTAAPAAPAAL